MRGTSAATCVSSACCSAAMRVSSAVAVSNSRGRMPSSRSDSSSSRAADCACCRTPSSRARSFVISPRTRSRSLRCGTAGAAMRTSRTSASARRLPIPRRELRQRLLRRLLLRFFLRRSFAARGEAAELHFDDERLVVIGSDFGDDVVVGQLQSLRLGHLLQRGLVVLEEQVLLIDALDVVDERALDELPRGTDAAAEIDRRAEGFEEVREQRVFLAAAGFVFADAEENDVAHLVLVGLAGQARRADEIGLHFRERAFVELREVAEEEIADDEAEDGVAEELEGLVVADAVALGLVGVRLVSERAAEQIAAPEDISDPLLEFGEAVVQSCSLCHPERSARDLGGRGNAARPARPGSSLPLGMRSEEH